MKRLILVSLMFSALHATSAPNNQKNTAGKQAISSAGSGHKAIKTTKVINTKAPASALIIDKTGKARPSSSNSSTKTTVNNDGKNSAKTDKPDKKRIVAKNEAKSTAKNTTNTANTAKTSAKNDVKNAVKTTAKASNKTTSKQATKTTAKNSTTADTKKTVAKNDAKSTVKNTPRTTAKIDNKTAVKNSTTAKISAKNDGKKSSKTLANKAAARQNDNLSLKNQPKASVGKIVATNTKRTVKTQVRTTVAGYRQPITLNGQQKKQTKIPQVAHSPAKATYLKSNQRQQVIANAKSLIGTPYRYGGNTPATGFDCSGFVSYVYRQQGIKLPRSSAAQFAYLPAVANPMPGDLVYFRRGGRINHAAIYLGNGNMIHSPQSGSRVRIENMMAANWQRRYAGARAVLPRNNSAANQTKIFAQK